MVVKFQRIIVITIALLLHNIECLKIVVNSRYADIVIKNTDSSPNEMDWNLTPGAYSSPKGEELSITTPSKAEPTTTKIVFNQHAEERYGGSYMFTIIAEFDDKFLTVDILMNSYELPQQVTVTPYCNILSNIDIPNYAENGVEFIFDTRNQTHLLHDTPVLAEIKPLNMDEEIIEFIGPKVQIAPVEYHEIYHKFKFLEEAKDRRRLTPKQYE